MTPKQRRLARRLRQLRVNSGMSLDDAAGHLGCGQPKITKIETCQLGAKPDEVRMLCELYGAGRATVESMVNLARTAKTRGWYQVYDESANPENIDFVELETDAVAVSNFEIDLVPGLLQTEDYARAIFSYRVPELHYGELELRVHHRIDRRVVIEDPDPVPYEALIHESALRIRVGDRAAARAQLRHVLELSEADHVTVRVIPFDLDGFAGAASAMTYVGGPVPKLDTALRDTPHGTAFIDAEAQLGALRTLFRKVETVSLEPERSRDFIHRLVKEL
jgi:transcriptional regulator with XRE-family HTH domain